jgi:hypothetical protein
MDSSPYRRSVLYYGTTRVTEVSLFALRRAAHVAALLFAITTLVGVSGCSRPDVTFVDSGATYDEQSVMVVAEGVDTSRLSRTRSGDAAKLRNRALTALRARGGRAVPVADVLTKTFSADTRGVPVYFERATFGGKPAVVMIEAAGPANGRLTAKRVWVLDEQGGVLFVGNR